MSYYFSLFLFLFQAVSIDAYITGIAVRLPLQGDRAAPGSPWPMPQEWHESSDLLTLNPANFRFSSNLAGCDVVEKAFARYAGYLILDERAEPDPDLEEVTQLTVTVTSSHCDVYPNQQSDESYDLTVEADGAVLEAPTVWGVLRGLETFSQLLFVTEEEDVMMYHLNATEIHDFPRYAFRAFLVDTARHFLPMSVLLTQIEVMSWNKLNVFHWHVVDDQSFPYPSRTFPNLTEHGAWSPVLQYSRDEVETVIEEARLRGIRVIPEFDTPGHTHSWGKALPRLITPCWGDGLDGGPYVADYPNHGTAEILNPMDEYVYDVMREIYTEIVDDFPDEYVHLGMDEVYYSCWETNPNISAWMVEQAFTEYWQVEQYYHTRLIDIVKECGAKYIIWQDPVDNNVTVDDDTLVVVWKDVSMGDEFEDWRDYMIRVTTKGYNAVLAGPWYLNVISYGEDWRTYYMIEPTNFTDDPELMDLVQGGEATAWAEYIDATNFIARIWPRASAVAERLWSAQDVDDVDSAAFRLDQQRCRMVRRGVPAQPISPGYCGDFEWGLGRPGRYDPQIPSASPDTEVSHTDTLSPQHTCIVLSLIIMLSALLMQ